MNPLFKRKLKQGDIFLIGVNLIPLIGVWFYGWDPRQMFIIYCLETVIIGGFNILKMFIVTLDRKKDVWENNGATQMVRGWFFILFFIFHYGLFVFVQTSLFAGVSGLAGTGAFGPFNFLFRIWDFLADDTKTVLWCFIAMYAFRMLFDFILSGKYREMSLAHLMFQPYLRIFIQQFVVIIGSMFLQFGAGKIFMLIFVAIKLYFELFIDFDNFLDNAEKMQKLKEMMQKKREL